ncbi:ferredoxin [Nocardioides massiliensis]|uniref:Ferredoxin n=1 Tax=Nocardioides massiliensis TaxID=1325935 RepID=A0ABT9NM16_9ACTN|nr:ferredoxin [Nocardioides massiliensis]MDP9821264.1 ferredoxin [Nocardioides massiliensis]
MRITVDRERCEGLGMCESMAPDHFEVIEDDDGNETVDILVPEPDASDRDLVQSAVQSCPVLALTFTG